MAKMHLIRSELACLTIISIFKSALGMLAKIWLENVILAKFRLISIFLLFISMTSEIVLENRFTVSTPVWALPSTISRLPEMFLAVHSGTFNFMNIVYVPLQSFLTRIEKPFNSTVCIQNNSKII